jgi:hypothetical protein
MSRWLVRTSQNEIHGPFEQGQLVESIQSGRWELRDEACRENHYWFAFHEAAELQSQLGIGWPGLSDPSSDPEEETDEITEIETETKILKDTVAAAARAPVQNSEPLIITAPPEQAWWTHPALVVFLVIFVAAALAFFLVP